MPSTLLMSHTPKKVELLAPAGNLEKLEIAIHYGADAIYLSGKEFSLRSYSGNFSRDEIRQAVSLAHDHDVRVYVACNVYSRNNEQDAITDYLHALRDISPDAVIISDPGILMEAFKIMSGIPVHLSTQANTTNYRTALFWKQLGVSRVNVARELTLKEIREIADRSAMEVEAFVHGAMCISYSGRCLLSSFMAKRDSNRGLCCHPCRWNYAVVEALRPGEYMPITEDDRGSYIFNSKDLCMIDHIPELIAAGIHSFKIEGRMKGINYLASVVKVYREAIDAWYRSPSRYQVQAYWREELLKINNRHYCTGFYFGDPDQIMPNYDLGQSASPYIFCGKITGATCDGLTPVEVRNKIFNGDPIEILETSGPAKNDKIIDIYDNDGLSVPFAQPGSRVFLKLGKNYRPSDLIRKLTQQTEPA